MQPTLVFYYTHTVFYGTYLVYCWILPSDFLDDPKMLEAYSTETV